MSSNKTAERGGEVNAKRDGLFLTENERGTARALFPSVGIRWIFAGAAIGILFACYLYLQANGTDGDIVSNVIAVAIITIVSFIVMIIDYKVENVYFGKTNHLITVSSTLVKLSLVVMALYVALPVSNWIEGVNDSWLTNTVRESEFPTDCLACGRSDGTNPSDDPASFVWNESSVLSYSEFWHDIVTYIAISLYLVYIIQSIIRIIMIMRRRHISYGTYNRFLSRKLPDPETGKCPAIGIYGLWKIPIFVLGLLAGVEFVMLFGKVFGWL